MNTHICLIVTSADATADGVVEESSGGSFAIANDRRRCGPRRDERYVRTMSVTWITYM